jgi:hypothetical protein
MKVTPVDLLKRRAITAITDSPVYFVSEQLKSKYDVTRFTSHLDKYFNFDIVCSIKTTR